jgi:glycosyltransferase involved in cell wall biosynthesis
MSLKGPRVLALADDCNPEWPSLPVVGYKYVKALSAVADVTLVTQVRNRPNIEKAGMPGARIEYLDTEKVAAPLAKFAEFLRGGQGKGWTLQMAMDFPAYLWFEREAWRRFGPDLRAGRFDIVHRVTPMSPTLPSYLAHKSPVPFVLGPLNGNLPWPPQFKAELAREREWLSFVRNFYKAMPYHHSTYRDSACILAAFGHTLGDLKPRYLPKAIDFPEVGIDPQLFAMPQRVDSPRVEILYAGRLVPYKLPEVVVRAVAGSPLLQRHRLRIAGDGPERPRLEAMVREAGLQSCIELLGQLPQSGVAQLMRESDVFAFPSIRELGAGVVVEAMASGLACVVVDYGGPATLVGPDRGIKVPMGSLDTLVAAFRQALESLVQDPQRVRALGRAAHAHALRHYAWDHKAERTVAVYRWLMDGRKGAKPGFWD